MSSDSSKSNRRTLFIAFAVLVTLALLFTWLNMSGDGERAEDIEEFNAPKPGEGNDGDAGGNGRGGTSRVELPPAAPLFDYAPLSA